MPSRSHNIHLTQAPLNRRRSAGCIVLIGVFRVSIQTIELIPKIHVKICLHLLLVPWGSSGGDIPRRVENNKGLSVRKDP